MGTVISLDFTPLHTTRRMMVGSGRLVGGRRQGSDGIFFYCLDWTLRFGSLSMNAMDEERTPRLRKWLGRLEGRTLRAARFDAEDTLELVFDGDARLTALLDSEEPDEHSYWYVDRHYRSVAWTDFAGPRTVDRYRGAD